MPMPIVRLGLVLVTREGRPKSEGTTSLYVSQKYNNGQQTLPTATCDPVSVNLFKEYVPKFYLGGMRQIFFVC